MAPRIEPQAVVELVERYIDDELRQAAKYDNREPFDDSGCWSLHELAAQIYATGYDHGERAEAERQRGERNRRRSGEVQ